MKSKKNDKNKGMLNTSLCKQPRLENTFSISKELIYKTSVKTFLFFLITIKWERSRKVAGTCLKTRKFKKYQLKKLYTS